MPDSTIYSMAQNPRYFLQASTIFLSALWTLLPQCISNIGGGGGGSGRVRLLYYKGVKFISCRGGSMTFRLGGGGGAILAMFYRN